MSTLFRFVVPLLLVIGAAACASPPASDTATVPALTVIAATPVPSAPTVDLEATVVAAVEATIAAWPTATPLVLPVPAETPPVTGVATIPPTPTPTPTSNEAPVATPALDFPIDPAQPLAVAGDEGWDYREVAHADLDGDGADESVVVIARVEATGAPAPNDFMWDDGQPWIVYVEELDGVRTYLYARYVQLGRLEVMVTDSAPGEPRNVLILERQGAGITLFEAIYGGPGEWGMGHYYQAPIAQFTSRDAPVD